LMLLPSPIYSMNDFLVSSVPLKSLTSPIPHHVS
jgi:hypothetical protein